MANVKFPRKDAEDVPGYLTPLNEGSKKGLVVIQEWWGLNEQIRAMADRFAQEGGFRALVPDLYRGKVAKDAEEAGHLMSGLDWSLSFYPALHSTCSTC